MIYKVELKEQAEKDLFSLAKSEPKAFISLRSLRRQINQ